MNGRNESQELDGSPMLARRAMLGGGLAAGIWGAAERSAAATPLTKGASQFAFEGWPGPPLTIHTFVPDNVGPGTKIVIVMHGQGRDANVYRDQWIPVARDRSIIIATPEFDRARFPSISEYPMGGLAPHDSETSFQPHPAAALFVIEPLFDEIRARTGSAVERYVLFGHSAGGQFAHRFAMFTPAARAEMIIAANSGWYTMPDLNQTFPYGLKGTAMTAADQRAMFARPLVVLLGLADNDPNAESLRKAPEAMAQGPHRLARGNSFFEAAKQIALQLETPFAWKRAYAPDVGHSNGAIAPYAAMVAFGPGSKF